MKSSSFKSQMLAFYFNINNLHVTEGANTLEEQLDAAFAINSRAYEVLEQALPQADVWIKQDDDQPEFSFSPYEICEESFNIEVIQGYEEAFSFCLFSSQQVSPADAAALLSEVTKAYEQAANELGGKVKFLRLVSTVTEEVKTTSEFLADSEQDDA